MRRHRRERLSWASGLGGKVTATISRPQEGAESRSVILCLDRDRSLPELERLYWDDRFRSYATVVNLAYTGQELDPAREGQVGSALIAAGRSLLAERVRDVLVTLAVLRERNVLGEARPCSSTATVSTASCSCSRPRSCRTTPAWSSTRPWFPTGPDPRSISPPPDCSLPLSLDDPSGPGEGP